MTKTSPAAQGTVIDLDKEDFDALCKAATESNWIPPEYMRNDWVSDCCRFLREGPQVFVEAPTQPPEALPASGVEAGANLAAAVEAYLKHTFHADLDEALETFRSLTSAPAPEDRT